MNGKITWALFAKVQTKITLTVKTVDGLSHVKNKQSSTISKDVFVSCTEVSFIPSTLQKWDSTFQSTLFVRFSPFW